MLRCTFLFSLFTTCSLLLTLGTATAQDPVQVSPDVYKVLLDNDQVRVIEYQSKPGQVDGMHSHPTRLAYTLTPVKLKAVAPDGSITDVDAKAGDLFWLGPVTNSLQNVGKSEAKILIVELKEQQRRSTIPLKQTDPWGSPW
jgi:quercetin dioxygenase-like cupin family protein